jgi:hypothetical protein
MRHLLAAAAAFAAILAAPAHAQPTQQIEVHASSGVPTSEIRGRYELSDGRTLELSARGRQLVAHLDGAATTVLRATGAQRYASRDGRLQVQLDVQPNGSVDSLTLTEWRGREAVRTASR